MRVGPDRDLRQDPGELRGSEPAVLGRSRTDGVLRSESGPLQEQNVDEVPNLAAGQEGAELVREDLLGRVDEDAVAIELLDADLGRAIAHEVDDDALGADADQESPEVRRGPKGLDRGAHLVGDGTERRDPLLEVRGRSEEFEVVGGPVPEVIPGERRAARQGDQRFFLKNRRRTSS